MKKIKSTFFIGIFLVAAMLPVILNAEGMQLYGRWNTPPDDDTTTTTVDIRNMGYNQQSDVYLQGRQTEIIVQSTTGNPVYYSVDGGSAITLTRYGTTDRYYATFDLNLAVGTHTVKAWSLDSTNTEISDTVTIEIVSNYIAHLYYEIDYMTGHVPTTATLNYWEDYWRDRAIDLNYRLDDEVPYEATVSNLFDYEQIYNDWEFQEFGTADDRTSTTGTYVYNSQEKWMLYGSADTTSSTGGYTYVDVANHRGNYIFICDSMIDNFEASYDITNDGAEVVVLMHEAGHSIGVLIVSTTGRGGEIYDQADKYDIMSTMYPENCGFIGHWYYADNYWGTRDLSYY